MIKGFHVILSVGPCTGGSFLVVTRCSHCCFSMPLTGLSIGFIHGKKPFLACFVTLATCEVETPRLSMLSLEDSDVGLSTSWDG